MKKVYARNTIVANVTNDVAQKFVDDYHSQESASPSTTVKSVGLFLQDEVVAVAQFCSPRTSAKKREYTTELLRMCFKEDYRVIGGASKLISFYKKTYSPSDIFTYQDTTGENTKVYEKCGFTLVSQSKTKQYLIAPKKTMETAKKNEKLTIAYASHLGPDNILGTAIGEKFDEDGSRKTNIQLFEELGWHIESTSGDKVYEWFDEEVTFYTYKITATGSEKYYFGVSHIRKKLEETSIEDCLNDGYYGSGGKYNKNNKFVNWKNKHKENLIKEVISVFPKKSEAYSHEKKLVGDAWKNNPNCLNSIEGGQYTGIHTGKSARFSTMECAIHGMSRHAGKTCCKCTAEKSVSLNSCEIHGETKFTGAQCRKCLAKINVVVKKCVIHGESKHIGPSCYKCLGNAFSSIMIECETHGISSHVNNICQKCVNVKTISMKNCQHHGLSKHRKEKCYQCSSENKVSFLTCSNHGWVKHLGNSCAKCTYAKSSSVSNCEIHGMTKFTGQNCRKCLNSSGVSTKDCVTHGSTKHIGEKCYKCRSTKYIVSLCDVHGETSFVGDTCVKCDKSDSVDVRQCERHGVTKHMDGVCSTCRSSKAIGMRECVFHGETKHRGNTCSKCTADKGAHRYHAEKTKDGCSLCEKEILEGSRKQVEKKTVSEQLCPFPMCDTTFFPNHSRQLFCSNPHPAQCASCGTQIAPVPRRGKERYVCIKRSCRGSTIAV